jgi:hypothetical protein
MNARPLLILTLTMWGCDSGPSKEECSALLQAVDSVKRPESNLLFSAEEAKKLQLELSEGAKRVEAVPVKNKELQAAQLRYVSVLRQASSKIKQQLGDAEAPKDAVNVGDVEKEEINQLCKGK